MSIRGVGAARHGADRVLRPTAAAALAVSAYLHIDLASGPPVLAGHVTLAGLFLAQALVAGVVALWVLARGGRPAWLAVMVVALGSLVALLTSVYVQVPAVGPFPPLYEPYWYAQKAVAAGSVALALMLAVPALLLDRRSTDVRARP